MTQKMLILLISEEAPPSDTGSSAYVVEALVVVAVTLAGGPNAGDPIELADPEDTGKDKGKKHKRKLVVSKTLMSVWHIVSGIRSKS